MSQSATPEETLRQRWSALWHDLRLSGDPAPPGEALLRAWAAPTRYSHNLTRLAECLLLFDEIHTLAFRPFLVEAAIWFHEAVHDTARSDNEALSAIAATRALTAGGLDADDIDYVRNLILATRGDVVPLPGDEALMADIALSILGAGHERFDRYFGDLRWESMHVPAPAYRELHRKATRELLDRPHLFHTERLRKRFEQPARDNLARSLRRQWRIH